MKIYTDKTNNKQKKWEEKHIKITHIYSFENCKNKL